jgi:hypothetical protein
LFKWIIFKELPVLLGQIKGLKNIFGQISEGLIEFVIGEIHGGSSWGAFTILLSG